MNWQGGDRNKSTGDSQGTDEEAADKHAQPLVRQAASHERLTNWIFAASAAVLALVAVTAIVSILLHPVSLHTCVKVLVSLGYQMGDALSTCLAQS